MSAIAGMTPQSSREFFCNAPGWKGKPGWNRSRRFAAGARTAASVNAKQTDPRAQTVRCAFGECAGSRGPAPAIRAKTEMNGASFIADHDLIR